MSQNRVVMTRQEFALLLQQWLANNLSISNVEQVARDLTFKINDEEDYIRIYQCLLSLNMWMVIRSCEILLHDETMLNDCLNIFHKIVYKKQVGKDEVNFELWTKLLIDKYNEYNNTMNTKSPIGRIWILSKAFNKYLFGDVEKNAIIQLKMSSYISMNLKNLREFISKSYIE